MQQIIVFICIIIISTSCTSPAPPSNPKSLEEIAQEMDRDKANIPYYQEFDTMEYVRSLNLNEELDLLKLAEGAALDTFVLKDHCLACNCASFFDIDSSKTNGYNPTHAYYLKPFNQDLELPSQLTCGTIITFIGTAVQPNLDNFKGSGSSPIPGRTLTYYYYKVHRPYFIWGEEVIGGYQSNDAGDGIDTLYRARSITVN